MASLSITALSSFFSDENKSLSRGENHYKSNHVKSISLSGGVLRGEVEASMKKRIYNVTIYLNEANEIRSSECECPRGAFKCSHAAALFIFGIYNISRTDVECSWRKRPALKASAVSVAEMFPAKKAYQPLTRSPCQEDRDKLYVALREYGKFTGLCWIMAPEPASINTLPIPAVYKTLFFLPNFFL